MSEVDRVRNILQTTLTLEVPVSYSELHITLLAHAYASLVKDQLQLEKKALELVETEQLSALEQRRLRADLRRNYQRVLSESMQLLVDTFSLDAVSGDPVLAEDDAIQQENSDANS